MSRVVAFFLMACIPVVVAASEKAVVLSDDFSTYSTGIWLGAVGAEAEYHYLPQTSPVGNWCVSTYRSEPESQRAWRIEDWDGHRVLAMEFENKWKDMHPIVVAGDPLWRDYTVDSTWSPLVDKGQSGILFRYRNDRCYYFFGVVSGKAILKYVKDGDGFRKPHEEILAEQSLSWKPDDRLTAHVEISGNRIHASLGDAMLDAAHDAFAQGRIALTADGPCRFRKVTVSMSAEAKAAFDKTTQEKEDELRALQAKNPKPVLWKKIRTDGFGVGRNLRFGDLDGDGRQDILVCQPVHHGPKDTRSEVSCLTAVTFEGKKLWQVGEPDPWKNHLTNDVAFQIHEIDGNGRNEVIYCKDLEIVIADGATGKTIRKTPTPEMPANTKKPYNNSPRIFGDCLFFCDLRGQGRAGDIVLKDRYQSFWVYDENLNLQWKAQCNTGHYPCAADIDNDGKDELAMGYSLFDHDGKLLWTLDKQLDDHDDGVAMAPLRPEKGAAPVFVCAASDEGMLFVDMKGNILKHLYLGHVQNPGIADFRPDLPGLEIVTVNFWGNQGIIHFYDANGDVYHDFEPFQHGSLCQPINWNGTQGEYVLLSANVEDGGLFDGWGRCVVKLPADGHPDMCCAALDVTGDCRDEIIVWDPYELWVYTQDDSLKPGRLYKPVRSPLYNDSNYRAIVSVPGWNDSRTE